LLLDCGSGFGTEFPGLPKPKWQWSNKTPSAEKHEITNDVPAEIRLVITALDKNLVQKD
jgi:hypothetical protein